MMSMPGKIHQGPLPPLTEEEKLRAERMRGDVVMLAAAIGFYSDRPGSEQYPPPLSLLYPDTGNFIGFVGNLSSRSLLHSAIKKIPRDNALSPGRADSPEFITGIGWSDHWAFWQEGYPGIMITDTAPFRYPHYHEPGDTPDKLDYGRMARVVVGLGRVVGRLVE